MTDIDPEPWWNPVAPSRAHWAWLARQPGTPLVHRIRLAGWARCDRDGYAAFGDGELAAMCHPVGEPVPLPRSITKAINRSVRDCLLEPSSTPNLLKLFGRNFEHGPDTEAEWDRGRR